MNEVVKTVMPEYQKKYSEKEEKFISAVQSILDSNGIKDEITRSKVIAKRKAFNRDLCIAGAEAGLFSAKQ